MEMLQIEAYYIYRDISPLTHKYISVLPDIYILMHLNCI